MEVLAVVGMANETNRLANALKPPVDVQFEPRKRSAHVEYEHASDEARAVYDDIMATRKSEWVNNFWKVLAARSGSVETHMGEHQAGRWRRARSIPLTKEMIYIAVSATNGCDYCHLFRIPHRRGRRD